MLRISEVNTIIGTVPQQPLESRQVMGRGDDEDIPDSGHHQHRDRIVDHRLIVDGQELLGDSLRDGIEAGSTAAGEHDTFHKSVYYQLGSEERLFNQIAQDVSNERLALLDTRR